MNIFDLKYRLHRSLDIFSYSAFLAMAILILLFFVQKDFWLGLLTPSILTFCIIGLHYVSKGLLILSEKEGEQTEMTEDEYIDRLYGIEGFRMIFILAAVIITVCGGIVLFILSPTLFTFSNFSYLSLIFVAIALYSIYKVSQELSFVIMSVTIIDTMKMKEKEK